MTDTTPAALQRLLAAEFDRRGWPYELGVVSDLVEHVENTGRVDATALAARVATTYLERNGITRGGMARAIQRAIGDRTVAVEPPPVMLVINDHSHNLTLGGNAAITGDVNVGGTQINIKQTANKDELIAAVEALVRAGLTGTLNINAALELQDVLVARDDITVEDIHAATVSAAAAEQPDRGRVRALLTQIATGGLGGALGTGISAGLGELLQQLPM